MAEMRPATEADIPRILDMGAALTARMGHPQVVDRIHAGASLAHTIRNGLVLVSDGGFVAGKIGQTAVNPEPVAFEMGWAAADGNGWALLGAYEAWAAQQGAAKVSVACREDRIRRALERRGYRLVEMQMMRSV